jgi:Spx/MgsR family transcriptional regulator
MVTINGIKNCDTMRKARSWLADHDVPYQFRDYRAEPPTEAELGAWADRLGWEALLNRSGTTFRKLPDAEKADLDRAKAIALMIANPAMIKRPLLDTGDTLKLGFRPEDYAALLAA